jgi:nucleotidyltransferase substrate binding protein (TIGR01987 family)
MERLKERLKVADKALATLCALSLTAPPDDVVRDAAIQRFEYTFEALWKAAQSYLQVREGLESGSPKSVVRNCLQVGVLTDAQARLALAMVDDRNLTVHTYNEELARRIFAQLDGYAELMKGWLQNMVSLTP